MPDFVHGDGRRVYDPRCRDSLEGVVISVTAVSNR
jgi:hypothetical protein